MVRISNNTWHKREIVHAMRKKPHIFSQWASIVQRHKENGHLTEEGMIKLQNFVIEELSREVAKTEEIEKENQRLVNLVNHMKKAFIKLKTTK